MVQKLEDRPPYVRFEKRSVEDREASIAAGHYVGRDVDFVLITPMGSKDCIERVVSEWFDKLKQDVSEGRCPREWLEGFKLAYKDWQEERESPVSGTPILDWPPCTPSLVKTLLSLQVRTVEDLSVANEEVLNRIGMGGRALKQRAIDWLASAKDVGKVSEASAALKAENDDLKRHNADLTARLASLEAQVNAMTSAQTAGKAATKP